MARENCETCEVLPTNNPLIETEYWMATLAPDQGYLGRSYVTLKEHKPSLTVITMDEWQDFAGVVSRYENAVRGAYGADVFNWGCLMNNAFQQEPALPHVHWHVRPRYGSNQPVVVNGLEFSDPNFGHHYDREHKQLVNKQTLQAIGITLLKYL